VASVKKRGPLQWQAKVRRVGYPEQSKTFDTKAEADEWARGIESKMDSGTFVDRRSLADYDVGYILAKYREEVTTTKKGKKQEKARLIAIEGRSFARLKLSLVDLPDGRKYRDDRLKEVAAGTVIKEMNLIGSVFNYAKSEWEGFRALRNPMEDVKRSKAPPGRERRPIEEGDELQMIIDATSSPILRAVLPVAADSAMRRGEMVNFRV